MKRSATQSADVLGNLVAERQKFEQWIAALEEKKASTPAKVYERVHADYTSRLAGVMEELGARSVELESQRKSLRERSSELSEQENALREERAEAELRNMVGEYSPQQWKEVAKTSDAGIAKLVAERSAVEAELENLNRILGGTSGNSSAKPASAAPAPSPAAAPAARQEEAAKAAPAQSVPAQPAARQTPAAGSAPAGASTPAARAPTPSKSVAGTPLGFPGSASAPSSSPITSERPAASAAPRSVPATPLETPPEPASAPGPRPHRPSFDELAFLSSVAPGSGKDKSVPPSNNAAEGSEPKVPAAADGASQSPGAPLRPTRQVNASDVGAVGIENLSSAKNETPSFLKNVPSEQTKTLKCGECNAMNYATEWYCERCGAELSAL